MLSELYIENIALIEKAEVKFNKGLTVLTGETGAGKSIVIDSINAVLGERVMRELIRTGAKKALVSAVFENLTGGSIAALVNEGIEPDEDGKLYVTREILNDGKNNCRINGRPVSVTVLKNIGQHLINVHGQHESQALLNEENHIKYLDLFAGNGELLAEFSEDFERYTEVKAQLKKLKGNIGERERERDMLRFQYDEIERAAVKVGEYDELLARRNFLQNAEKLAQLLNDAHSALSGGEYSDGAVSLVSSCVGNLEETEKIYDKINGIKNKASEALYLLEDTAAELAKLCRDTEYSPQELESIEQRLSVLSTVMRKYGQSEEKVLQYFEDISQRLSLLDGGEDATQQLEAELEQRLETVKASARRLRASRRSAAQQFEKQVALELAFLEMPNVTFKATVEPTNLNACGADTVCFLLSANIGEEPKPLAKIASGGELSRIMLAIKSVLCSVDEVGTLIFDEVDAGISGKAAYKVGKKLRQTAEFCQTVCVTHLAQIAALANNHIYIEKNSADGRTLTTLTELDYEGRKRELARIIGGGMISNSALEAAADMLSAENNT